MDVTRAAGLLTILGILTVAAGVGFYDWRAGLISFGVQALAVGIWTLTKE